MADSIIRIGLTMRVIESHGYVEPRDALAQDWSRFLHEAIPGVAWMYLPNLGSDRIPAYCDQWGINALILTGGENIGAEPLRDDTERSLLSWAEQRDYPALGICRGMQLMAICAGTKLKSVKQHVKQRHALHGDIVREVNSYHEFSLTNCPEGYTVTASAPDGEIEAIRHNRLKWEGWMWHPEREENFDKADQLRLWEILS